MTQIRQPRAAGAAQPSLDFAIDVPPRGYRWWYVDASSDDGAPHLVVIAFVGSVFSPFYKRAVARGDADPMDYCAINVALYSRPNPRWCMTELRQDEVQRDTHRLQLAATSLQWTGDRLVIDVADRSAPTRLPLRGRIEVTPAYVTGQDFALTANARHHWWPISPSARVAVEFSRPAMRWQGSGYFDTNSGSEPLHEGFDFWHWSRTHQGDNTHLAYNATERSGNVTNLGLMVDATGAISEVPAYPEQRLPPSTIWRAPRASNLPGSTSVSRTLEDTPFYARSIITTDAAPGQTTMHESLSLDRFRASWVTTLIPFRMRFPLGKRS